MTTPPTPPPIDVEALLTSLYAVAATYQARALGCRHLAEAAKSKQLGLIAADAVKEAGVYEDCVSRIYGQIDAVRAETKARQRGAAVASPQPSPFTMLPGPARTACELAVNAKATPLDRYNAFVQLATTMAPATLSSHAVALADAYHAVWDVLPDFPQVVAVFDEAVTRGGDWAAKCETSRKHAVDGVGLVFDADVDHRVTAHHEDIAGLEFYLRSLPQHGGAPQQMAEEALRQLTRLKDDVTIRVWLARLKQGGVK